MIAAQPRKDRESGRSNRAARFAVSAEHYGAYEAISSGEAIPPPSYFMNVSNAQQLGMYIYTILYLFGLLYSNIGMSTTNDLFCLEDEEENKCDLDSSSNIRPGRSIVEVSLRFILLYIYIYII